MDRTKISYLQFMLLWVTVVFSPLVLQIPKILAITAKQASWLCPVVSAMIMISFSYVFHNFFKKHPNASYIDIIYLILGRAVGKILLCLYLLIVTLSIGFHPRMFYERLSSSIMPNTPPSLFLIFLLASITFAIYQKFNFVVMARLNEVFLRIIGIIFIWFNILLLFTIDVNKLLPVSTLDFVSITKGGLEVSGLWGYLPFMFFMSHLVNKKGKILSLTLKFTLVQCIVTTIVVITTIGTAGYTVIARNVSPFYFCVKSISFLDIFQRMESLVIIIWILSDFIVILFAMLIILELLKSLFNLKSNKSLIIPLVIFSYLLSTYLAESRYELDSFYYLILVILVIVAYLIPPILLVIGKIRNKI